MRIRVEQLSDRELVLLKEAYRWIADDDNERPSVRRFYTDLADALTDVRACRNLRAHLSAGKDGEVNGPDPSRAPWLAPPSPRRSL